jgi:O-antigen/teichoic acid export membrane protein
MPFHKIKKYFYKQTFYNSIGAIIIFSSIFISLKIYQIYNLTFLGQTIDKLLDYQTALLFSSLAFVIVALMGPITNILLCMKKQKIYGFITFTSSILGIPIQFIISKFFGFEGFLLSSTFSAMVSNIASRIILERFPYKRGT